MSAVSSESHEPAVEPGQPAAGQADFGANEWLVEELYQRYLADPGSVDRAWWSFFADYHPTLPNGTAPQSPQPQTPAPALAPAPALLRLLRLSRPLRPRRPGPLPRARLRRRRLLLPLRGLRSAGCAGRRPAPSAT